MSDIHEGDHVTIGNGTVHWVVNKIYRSGNHIPLHVELVSGMTGRKWSADYNSLTLYARRLSEGVK